MSLLASPIPVHAISIARLNILELLSCCYDHRAGETIVEAQTESAATMAFAVCCVVDILGGFSRVIRHTNDCRHGLQA